MAFFISKMGEKKTTKYHRFVNYLNRKLEMIVKQLQAVLRHLRYEKYMLEFEEREDDVYIVTYPKSGTTLTQMLLYQLFTDGNIDFNHIYDVSPWIKNDVYEGKSARKIDHRRAIKSHDPYDKMPRLFKGKIIFVYRDGMDTATSMYQQKKDYNASEMSFDQFLGDSFFGKGEMNWVKFTKDWFNNKRNHQILYLSYNELTSQKELTIDKIVKYCNLDKSKIDLKRVLERTSFDFMKKHETKFGNQPAKQKPVFNNFIREGKSGNGGKNLTDKQKEFFSKIHNNSIKPLLEEKDLPTG